MEDEFRLKVFISHSGRGRGIWEPLVQLIKDLYRCKIIWEHEEVKKYQDPETLMEEMVKKSDVALFLLTHESDGVFHEMKLWRKYNSGNFVNALVLRDHSVLRETVKQKTGFEVTDIGFSIADPWADIHFIFPAVNELLKGGSLAAKLPPWLRAHNKIVNKYNWKVKRADVPVNRIRTLFKKIAANPRYEDPEKWSFRINWSTGAPDLDSYSDDTTGVKLFDALLQTDATRMEYELVFDALARAIEKNDEPPRKLAASILFTGCSMSTLESIKEILGNHPYEKNIGFERKRALYAAQVPDSPESLLLPKNILIQSENYERFLASQRLILSAVSKVCKYVQCSTVEVTASHSFMLDTVNESINPKLLAMSCTATRTNKDSLAAISEVPVIIEVDKRITWYGQLHKKPTSEYRPHWLYHNRDHPDRVSRNLLVHFHPVALLDAFRRVHERDGINISEGTFTAEVDRFFKVNDIDFHVYGEYEKYSSRSDDFGFFMRDNIVDNGKEYCVIWKPNHGIWVFLDDQRCSDSKLVETFLTLDRLSLDAAHGVCPELNHKV